MVKTIMIDWSLFNREPLHKNGVKKLPLVKAFIQARTGSTRLPNKIYEDINGAPMLFHTINMAKQCKLLDDVIVISPQPLPELPQNIKEFVYSTRNEEDVLSRYRAALEAYPCDYIVRLTSDCPLLDPNLIDFVIFCSIGYDYGSNVLVPTFPDGMDVEVISKKTLEYLDKISQSKNEREHVTTLVRTDPQVQVNLSLVSVQAYQDCSYIKLSVDTKEDLQKVREMENYLCHQSS